MLMQRLPLSRFHNHFCAVLSLYLNSSKTGNAGREALQESKTQVSCWISLFITWLLKSCRVLHRRLIQEKHTAVILRLLAVSLLQTRREKEIKSTALLTSTRRPMLAMWGEDSPTVSSFSICLKNGEKKRYHVQLINSSLYHERTNQPFSSTRYLSCKAAAEVHGTGASFRCLEPQHDSGGEFVVSGTTTGLLLFAKTEATSNYAKHDNMLPSRKDNGACLWSSAVRVAHGAERGKTTTWAAVNPVHYRKCTKSLVLTLNSRQSCKSIFNLATVSWMLEALLADNGTAAKYQTSL